MKVTADTLEFENIDDLCIFVRYNPKNNKSVPSGYVLAEDVANNDGGILYAREAELDASRIGRLKRIIENNSEINPRFVIKLNDSVVKIEQAKILNALSRLIESKTARNEFSRMMPMVKSSLESRINDILKDPEITLYISRMKFMEDKTKKSKINPFYNHILNTLIFSMGIVGNLYILTQEEYSPEETGDIGVAALLYAAGGWETSGQYMELSIEERHAKFIEANEKNYTNLKVFKLNNDVLDAIDFCYNFQIGQLDFLEKDSKAANYAKIVSVASLFDESISGLWGSARTPREVTDSFYVKTTSNMLPKLYVDAIAKGLKFSSLFDFYHELETLMKSCKRDAGKPYPMTGFKSPIIFVCKNNIYECKEFVASAKSITVFKEVGGLEEGSYGRCEGLSDRLIQFYESHYKEIKDEVLAKQFGISKEGDEHQ